MASSWYNKNAFTHYAISFKETCHHWIDYQIFEALPFELRKRYVDQFDIPVVTKARFSNEEDLKVVVRCRANYKDPLNYGLNACGCENNYKQTIAALDIQPPFFTKDEEESFKKDRKKEAKKRRKRTT